MRRPDPPPASAWLAVVRRYDILTFWGKFQYLWVNADVHGFTNIMSDLVGSGKQAKKNCWQQLPLLLPAVAADAFACFCSLLGNDQAKQKCWQHHCWPRTSKISYHLSRLKSLFNQVVVWSIKVLQAKRHRQNTGKHVKLRFCLCTYPMSALSSCFQIVWICVLCLLQPNVGTVQSQFLGKLASEWP